MPLPKINEKTLNNSNSQTMLKQAQDDLYTSLCSDEMQNAIKKLKDSNPTNVKIQNMCSTYSNVLGGITSLSNESSKDPAKYVERWNRTMESLSTLAGYDKNGVYNEEDSLFNVVNSSLDNKTIDTKTYTTLMTLDNNAGSSISTLSSYSKQLDINSLNQAYHSELDTNKNYNYEPVARYFESVGRNSFTAQFFSKEGQAEEVLSNYKKDAQKLEEEIKHLNPDKDKMAYSISVNGLASRQRQNALIEDQINKRDILLNNTKRTIAARENSDNGFKNLESTIHSNDYPEQVMQFLDKNIKQMDKGRRLFHRDSKEFKAMKTEMQDLKKYLTENKGKVDLDTLQDKLDKLGKTAFQYTDAKSKGMNVGSNMRNMRLNLANSIEAFSHRTVHSIALTKGAAQNFQQLQQVKNEAQASRSQVPLFNTRNLGEFMASGFNYTEAYRKTHPQQPQNQNQMQNQRQNQMQNQMQNQKKTEKVKGGISAPQ